MTLVVVDASAVMAILVPDEQGPISDLVLTTLETFGIAVPQHWPLEIANALLMATRRGRLTAVRSPMAIAKAEAVMATATIYPILSIGHLLQFSADFGMTAYDGAYVDLARRLDCPLLTNDRAMRSAATAVSVKLIA